MLLRSTQNLVETQVTGAAQAQPHGSSRRRPALRRLDTQASYHSSSDSLSWPMLARHKAAVLPCSPLSDRAHTEVPEAQAAPLPRALRPLARCALRLLGRSDAVTVGRNIDDHERHIATQLHILTVGPRGEETYFRCAVAISHKLSALQNLERYLQTRIGRLLIDDTGKRQQLLERINAICARTMDRLQYEHRLAKRIWRRAFRADVAAVGQGVMPHAALNKEIARLDGLIERSLLHTPRQQQAFKFETAQLRETAGHSGSRMQPS